MTTGLAAIETIEHMRTVRLRDTGPVIGHGERDMGACIEQPQLHRRRFRTVFQGIGDQIGQNVIHELTVAPGGAGRSGAGEADIPVGIERPELSAAFPGDLREIAMARLRAHLTAIEPPREQSRVDQPGEAVDRVADRPLPPRDIGAGHGVAAPHETLHRAVDDGERRAELVGDDRREVAVIGAHRLLAPQSLLQRQRPAARFLGPPQLSLVGDQPPADHQPAGEHAYHRSDYLPDGGAIGVEPLGDRLPFAQHRIIGCAVERAVQIAERAFEPLSRGGEGGGIADNILRIRIADGHVVCRNRLV